MGRFCHDRPASYVAPWLDAGVDSLAAQLHGRSFVGLVDPMIADAGERSQQSSDERQGAPCTASGEHGVHVLLGIVVLGRVVVLEILVA